MVQGFQNLDLANGRNGETIFLLLRVDAFQSHNFSGLAIFANKNASVSTLPYLVLFQEYIDITEYHRSANGDASLLLCRRNVSRWGMSSLSGDRRRRTCRFWRRRRRATAPWRRRRGSRSGRSRFAFGSGRRGWRASSLRRSNHCARHFVNSVKICVVYSNDRSFQTNRRRKSVCCSETCLSMRRLPKELTTHSSLAKKQTASLTIDYCSSKQQTACEMRRIITATPHKSFPSVKVPLLFLSTSINIRV